MKTKIYFLSTLVLCTILIGALKTKILDSAPPLANILNPFHGLLANNQHLIDHKNQRSSRCEGLREEVTVLFDEYMVPHIYALSIEDLLFAQGYVHAHMRLWQMDIQTRAASGRLSEVLGPSTLQADQLTRRLGLLEGAQLAEKKWKENEFVYGLLEAYSKGVNKFIDELSPASLPVEFKLLDYQPEPWTPLKCALMTKNMARTLCLKENDLEHSNLAAWLPDSIFSILFNDFEEGFSPVIPEKTSWKYITNDKRYPQSQRNIQFFGNKPYEDNAEGIGSNNWAIGPNKSLTGNAFLCSDPHLNLTHPSIWFENHLNGPDIDVYGVSIPGLPGVIIGFNTYIAWAQTNVAQDVLDWFTIDWADEKKGTYWLDGKETQIETRLDTHYIKGASWVVDTVKITEFGPIVYDTETSQGRKGMAMTWLAALEPRGNDPKCIIEINKARNYREFYEGLRDYDSPAQNYVYADVEGNIGMHVHGRFPLRRSGQGKFVQEGNTSANKMNQFIPAEHNAKSINPPRGFVSSANQVSTDSSYPYYYSGSFAYFRGILINRTLEKDKKFGVEDMMNLQTSAQSYFPEMLVNILTPAMDTLCAQDASLQQKWQQIKSWDFVFDKYSTEPVIFELFWEALYNLIWDEFDQEGLPPLKKPSKASTLLFMKNHPKSSYFDRVQTEEKEELADILMLAFGKAVQQWEEGQKGEGKTQNWINFKPVHIEHLAKIPAFSDRNIATSGHKDAPNALNSPAGPSWRMVVEMSNPIKAYGIYPGGQSGDPFSKHFRDRTETWAKNEYHPLHFPSTLDEPVFQPSKKWVLTP
jgi:penicillin G amidase